MPVRQRFAVLARRSCLTAGELSAAQAARTARRTVALIVTNGIVVTVDGSRRVLTPGAVAIDGTRHRRRRHAGGHRRRVLGRADHRRAGPDRPARADQHAHARADGAAIAASADDLALMDWLQKYIFPAEAKTVSPGVRPHRHAAGRARDDPVGHDDLRRHVLLRGGDRARRRTKPACAACSARRSSSSRCADAKTPAEGAGAHRALHQGVQGRSADHAGGGAARALHARDRRRSRPCRALADKYGVPLLIHLAETRRRGRHRAPDAHQATPTRLSRDRSGFWGPRTLAAHGVWVVDRRTSRC